MVRKNTTIWGSIIEEEGDFAATFGVNNTPIYRFKCSFFVQDGLYKCCRWLNTGVFSNCCVFQGYGILSLTRDAKGRLWIINLWFSYRVFHFQYCIDLTFQLFSKIYKPVEFVSKPLLSSFSVPASLMKFFFNGGWAVPGTLDWLIDWLIKKLELIFKFS